MVSGSVASARHGETRVTQGIDIVIEPTPEQIGRICDGFRAMGWHVGDGRAALERRSQFNAIDTETGWKVDLAIRRDRPFSREEFARRLPATIGGVATWIVTAARGRRRTPRRSRPRSSRRSPHRRTARRTAPRW